MIKHYNKKYKIKKHNNYPTSETNSFFSEKEFIIRANGKTKVFKISKRFQIFVFSLMICVGLWFAYSYQLYSASGRIISYQEKQLGKTRSAYVDLMSDFIMVHKNISAMISPNTNEGNDDAEEYLKKAQIIEEKIRQISAKEAWIDEKDVGQKTELKDALINRDVAEKETEALREKVAELEDVITALQSFEMDILSKVEGISNKEIDKIKTSISGVNAELKKRGKYFNPLANSKKNNKGGLFVPDSISVTGNEDLVKQAGKTFLSLDDNLYYKEAMKKIPLGKPVWTYWLSSPFGKRSDPFNKKGAVHKGVDLAANKGNKVKSMASGRVTKAGWANGYGKVIEIDHGNGFKTKYAHLNAIYVSKGQDVKAETAIGEVGSTGRSTGPHLHYEILYEGVNVDPMVFMKAK